MESGIIQDLRAQAGVDLASIRNGILVFVQDGASVADLEVPVQGLRTLEETAKANGFTDIGVLAAKCLGHLEDLSNNEHSGSDKLSRQALDLLADIEASLLTDPLLSDDFFANISDFVDESFDNLRLRQPAVNQEHELQPGAGFEIDDETMEIFRSEASELLGTISASLKAMSERLDDREALWTMRRSIHTLKGAAGIVGMKEASKLSHRIEDLLDQMAEDRCKATHPIIELLTASSACLNAMAQGEPSEPAGLAAIYSDFDRIITDDALSSIGLAANSSSGEPQLAPTENVVTQVKSDLADPRPAPIVRVSLERLDELQAIARRLEFNRNSLAGIFAKFTGSFTAQQIQPDILAKLDSLMAAQLGLTNDIQLRLEQIRLVRFGMLATRLNRAVHVTCQEEDKKAEVIIENEDLELDTQIVDALVEPLLHLLRNAVVHGIESCETRRMIGKPEMGLIGISVFRSDSEVTVTVSDDGRGIAAAKLREKALSSGTIDQHQADSITDVEAIDLMFLRGVTTAETLNLNAGRGVGMCIVKESVEARNGSISIVSEPHKGTAFTIRIPVPPNAASSVLRHAEHGDAPEVGYPAPLCILIVDDSAVMRQLTSKMVENAGWRAVTAIDGEDAVKKLRTWETRPDLILTDLEMPRLNGYELLETLKQDVEFCDIPVVMVTSRSEDAHREKAIQLGAAVFLTKPLNEAILIAHIKQLCPASTSLGAALT